MVPWGRKWNKKDRRGAGGEQDRKREKEIGGKVRRKGPLSLKRPMVRREVCLLKRLTGGTLAKVCFSLHPHGDYRKRRLLQVLFLGEVIAAIHLIYILRCLVVKNLLDCSFCTFEVSQYWEPQSRTRGVPYPAVLPAPLVIWVRAVPFWNLGLPSWSRVI